MNKFLNNKYVKYFLRRRSSPWRLSCSRIFTIYRPAGSGPLPLDWAASLQACGAGFMGSVGTRRYRRPAAVHRGHRRCGFELRPELLPRDRRVLRGLRRSRLDDLRRLQRKTFRCRLIFFVMFVVPRREPCCCSAFSSRVSCSARFSCRRRRAAEASAFTLPVRKSRTRCRNSRKGLPFVTATIRRPT